MPKGPGVFFLRRDVPVYARELPRFYKAVLKPLYVSFGEEVLRAIFDWCEAPQRMRSYAKDAFDAIGEDADDAAAGQVQEVGDRVNWLASASEGLSLMDILAVVDQRGSRSVEDFIRDVIMVSTTDVPPAIESDSEPEGEDDTPARRKSDDELEARRLNKERSLGSNLKDILNASRKSLDDLEQVLERLIEQWKDEELSRKNREDGLTEGGTEASGTAYDTASPTERVVRSFNMCLLLDVKFGESVGVCMPDAMTPRIL